MVEVTNPDEIEEVFERVDGIEVTNGMSWDRVIVKVMDEAAVGEYFRLTRTLPVRAYSQSRGHLDDTVLDAWVEPEE